jgi:hypothetical protein
MAIALKLKPEDRDAKQRQIVVKFTFGRFSSSITLKVPARVHFT